MKNPALFLVGALLILTLTGCEEIRYSPYSGSPKAWPTGSAFSEVVFDVPVYRGWPERAYDVLGHIQFSNPDMNWNQGDMKLAAGKAKQMGGDAILMIPKGDTASTTLGAVRNDLGIGSGQTIALVLKWK
jgi:hypothetical protein